MDSKQKPIPFGLLFEEPAPQPQGLMNPIYDEETDLSYVEDSHGRRVPCVEFAGILATETDTYVTGESTDQDEQPLNPSAATQTVTEVRREETDKDPGEDRLWFFASAATQTVTAVQAESTDTDPGDDRESPPIRKPLASTDTATKIVSENTDED